MILLDTHTWLWWIQGAADLPVAIRQLIDDGAEPVAVAAVSCLEVAWLVRKRRISMDRPLEEWFRLAIDDAGLMLLPLTPAISARAAFLPDIHNDPIDRVIVATAIVHSARLLSKDGLIARYPDVNVSWPS